MQSPPFPRYLLPPRSKHSPQHHILKHPQLFYTSANLKFILKSSAFSMTVLQVAVFFDVFNKTHVCIFRTVLKCSKYLAHLTFIVKETHKQNNKGPSSPTSSYCFSLLPSPTSYTHNPSRLLHFSSPPNFLPFLLLCESRQPAFM